MPRQVNSDDLQKISDILASQNGKDGSLGTGSKISLQWAAGILIFVIGFAITLVTFKVTTTIDIANLQKSDRDMQGQINNITGSRWSYPMMRQFVKDFRYSNPEIKLPDIQQIHDDYSPTPSPTP